MYIKKLSPEESLEAIKLRMKYDLSKTLNENVVISEQLPNVQNKPTTNQSVVPNKPQGPTLYSYPQNAAPTSGLSITDYTKLKQSQQKGTQPVKTIQIPNELKNVEGVKKFQDYLDQNYPKWHNKYGTLKKDVNKGYGKFGPRTSKWWKEIGKDFILINDPKNQKHGMRIIFSDGNTAVWDGRDKKWLRDQDWLKIYNYDGSFRSSLPKTQTGNVKAQTSVAQPSASVGIQPTVNVTAKVIGPDMEF
jgi:hypothetical protein